MEKKEFIKKAIENGFTGSCCKGWDWIRDNIQELDYIFQTKEYKDCNRMKSKCLPLILEKDDFSKLEEDVLSTAWYCNNEKEYAKKKTEKIEKFNKDGFFNIENKETLSGKKIEFIVDNSDDIFGGLHRFVGKLYWSTTDNFLMAMPSRNRRRGYWINEKIFVKFV